LATSSTRFQGQYSVFENRRTFAGTGGSNPSLSASFLCGGESYDVCQSGCREQILRFLAKVSLKLP